jgi:hypothetical protein
MPQGAPFPVSGAVFAALGSGPGSPRKDNLPATGKIDRSAEDAHGFLIGVKAHRVLRLDEVDLRPSKGIWVFAEMSRHG